LFLYVPKIGWDGLVVLVVILFWTTKMCWNHI